MTEFHHYTLSVPGATIAYDVGGDGPPLMMLGSPMTADGFAPLAGALARQYTVITYDPRSLGRSVSVDPDADTPPEVQADDVHRLLQTLRSGPAYVFGSSGGAVTGLALLGDHPEDVRRLVAHEPPAIEFLPDAEQQRAGVQRVHDAYVAGGFGAGMAAFGAFAGFGPPPQRPDRSEPAEEEQAAQRSAEEMARQRRDLEFLLGHLIFTTTLYRPDLDRLRDSDKLIIGVGASSGQQLARRTAEAVAEAVGLSPVEFPGGHTGFLSDVPAFAEKLISVLQR